MATWAKMSVTVLVALLPGGFLFLFCWAVWRAWSSRWRLAQEIPDAVTGERPGALRLLATLEIRDLLREARSFSGLQAGTPGR